MASAFASIQGATDVCACGGCACALYGGGGMCLGCTAGEPRAHEPAGGPSLRALERTEAGECPLKPFDRQPPPSFSPMASSEGKVVPQGVPQSVCAAEGALADRVKSLRGGCSTGAASGALTLGPREKSEGASSGPAGWLRWRGRGSAARSLSMLVSRAHTPLCFVRVQSPTGSALVLPRGTRVQGRVHLEPQAGCRPVWAPACAPPRVFVVHRLSLSRDLVLDRCGFLCSALQASCLCSLARGQTSTH